MAELEIDSEKIILITSSLINTTTAKRISTMGMINSSSNRNSSSFNNNHHGPIVIPMEAMAHSATVEWDHLFNAMATIALITKYKIKTSMI